jgi:hypothetical protein
VWLGLGVAGVASLALNLSYLVQHAGLAAAPRVTASRPLATLRGLLASPAWRAGAALGYGGLVLNAIALALAPLALVQVVIAAGLVVVAVGSHQVARRPVARREVAAVATILVALSALAVAPPATTTALPDVTALLAFSAVSGGGALLLARAGSSTRLGLAAGLLYGATNVSLAVLAECAQAGSLLGPEALVAAATGVVVTAGGFFAFQRGLQTGRPTPVVILMTAGTTAVAIAGGLVLLGERLGAGVAAGALDLLAFALVPLAAALAAPTLIRRPRTTVDACAR